MGGFQSVDAFFPSTATTDGRRRKMEWNEVLADNALADLPYKIELNEWGKIEMSPASNRHSALQSEILFLLRSLMKTGKAFNEISIATSRNVKVADAVWASDEFYRKHELDTPYPLAPDICVEVLSPGNTRAEMNMKKDLYLAKGAKEVWFCAEDGTMAFHDHSGVIERSEICPDFPERIEP
jgi:Uma2 family endonuclease